MVNNNVTILVWNNEKIGSTFFKFKFEFLATNNIIEQIFHLEWTNAHQIVNCFFPWKQKYIWLRIWYLKSIKCNSVNSFREIFSNFSRFYQFHIGVKNISIYATYFPFRKWKWLLLSTISENLAGYLREGWETSI